MKTRSIKTPLDLVKWIGFLTDQSLPMTVTQKKGAGRSLNQNSLIHGWYGEIAKQSHQSASEVKGQCHHKYGLPIKLRDEVWAWVWEQTGANLGYERQCTLLASGRLTVSSSMTTKELKEYLDAMHRDYLAEGYTLTDPERVGEVG